MSIAISFQHTADEFPEQLSIDQKIEIFRSQVLGWQLKPAQDMADNILHSGFAVLHIIMSYFEAMSKFRHGYAKKGDSEKFWVLGFQEVFPELQTQIPNQSERGEVLANIYEQVRCGLYHAGITGPSILLTANTDKVIDVDTSFDPTRIVINPHTIVPRLAHHFMDYIRDLRDPQNDSLRRNFEARFDFLGTT
ncbi:MAG: hypothetical protein JNJ61_28450 [Anaerolineae bacterium]|nr:hypothetical protein [Anaerolineae bacterium]